MEMGQIYYDAECAGGLFARDEMATKGSPLADEYGVDIVWVGCRARDFVRSVKSRGFKLTAGQADIVAAKFTYAAVRFAMRSATEEVAV